MLGGHKAGIIDIKIHVERRFVFSYGKDAVIKLWDLDKATISQTIGLHFPSFSVLGKEIEFGRPGMYIETGTPDVILVICCEHMTELRLLEERYSSQEVGLLAAPDEVCWPDNTIQRYTNGDQSITVTVIKANNFNNLVWYHDHDLAKAKLNNTLNLVHQSVILLYALI